MSKLDKDFPGAEHLIAAGYTTTHRVESATDDELLAIENIGPETLKKIRAASPSQEIVQPEVSEGEIAEVQMSSDPLYPCPNPRCGHLITGPPCGYCGQS